MSGLFSWLIEQLAALYKWGMELVWNLALTTLFSLIGPFLDSVGLQDIGWEDHLKAWAEVANFWLPIDFAIFLCLQWIGIRGTTWLFRLTIGRLFNR